jgi:hypothetical protein
MTKGFGPPQKTPFDHLVDRIQRYCQKRSPEALDRVFHALPQNDAQYSHRVLVATAAQLAPDLDSIGWFCSYLASEVNHAEDSDRYLAIGQLCSTLILLGFEPFADFMPYPGQRIVILETEKFEALPQSIQAKLNHLFEIQQKAGEEFEKINEAIRQELIVS